MDLRLSDAGASPSGDADARGADPQAPLGKVSYGHGWSGFGEEDGGLEMVTMAAIG
jgi:hypothetical protein